MNANETSQPRTLVNWQQIAEAHAETLRLVLLDLAFDTRTPVSDLAVERCRDALMYHRQVTA
jgi:hypothetical protein